MSILLVTFPQGGTQSGRARSIAEGSLNVHEAVAYKLRQFPIEVLHVFRRTRCHALEQGVGFTFTVLNTGARLDVCLQDLQDRNAGAAVGPWHEPLRDDVAKRFRKASAH